MIVLPAIDLYKKKAVRLLKGNYDDMTVYSDNPVQIARDFKNCGATHIHMVDLEGAKDGTTPNISVVERVVKETSLFIEIGGGIRSMDVVDKYFAAGVSRVILGTAAVTDDSFLKNAIDKYGNMIAVGADAKNGFIAIKGWVETTETSLDEFFLKMQKFGVSNIICTDISKDGAMKGPNLSLYKELSERYSISITASGGVSDIDDIKALREMNMYGVIIGKAYYTGAIDLKEAIEVAKC